LASKPKKVKKEVIKIRIASHGVCFNGYKNNDKNQLSNPGLKNIIPKLIFFIKSNLFLGFGCSL
jgi:hypothetical protein